MILHPGILTLLGGAGIALLMMLYASGLALRIVCRWDFRSSSEEQLALERRTFLVSSVVKCALGFETVSLLLFVFTLDEIHPLFVGAMCATGTLNANPVGWTVLYVKIGIFFAAALWVALNRLDGRCEDLPLVRIKYAALLVLTPLVGLEFFLLLDFFSGLRPEVITSCCGSLFSVRGEGLAADLAGLPVRPMMAVQCGVAALFTASALSLLRWPDGRFRTLLALLAVLFFPVSIASLVSFVSLYIYELPTHHCPFDMLQKQYGFVGYPLYAGLFGGTLLGVMPGFFQPLRRVPSLHSELERKERKWVILSLSLVWVFLALSFWPVMAGPFRMLAVSTTP